MEVSDFALVPNRFCGVQSLGECTAEGFCSLSMGQVSCTSEHIALVSERYSALRSEYRGGSRDDGNYPIIDQLVNCPDYKCFLTYSLAPQTLDVDVEILEPLLIWDKEVLASLVEIYLTIPGVSWSFESSEEI